MWKLALSILAFLAAVAPAMANDLDDCVLAHMQGVQSDFAAKQVKISCVNTVAKIIPPVDINMIFQHASGYYSPSAYVGFGNILTKGWVIEFFNDSSYVISHITVTLTDKKGNTQIYELGPFNFVGSDVLPDGGVLAGPPPDPTWNMVLGTGEHRIYISDTGGAVKDFSTVAGWDVIGAKGWSR